jgi:hypothetical protein
MIRGLRCNGSEVEDEKTVLSLVMEMEVSGSRRRGRIGKFAVFEYTAITCYLRFADIDRFLGPDFANIAHNECFFSLSDQGHHGSYGNGLLNRFEWKPLLSG